MEADKTDLDKFLGYYKKAPIQHLTSMFIESGYLEEKRLSIEPYGSVAFLQPGEILQVVSEGNIFECDLRGDSYMTLWVNGESGIFEQDGRRAD